MLQSQKLKWVYALAALFILTNAAFLYFEVFWFVLLPFALLLVLYYFFSLDKLMWFIVFTTPLSVIIKHQDFNIGVSLPTEPFIFGVMVMFFLKLFFEKNPVDKKLLYHPVTIAIVAHLCWIFITCFTSIMPMVSFKYLLVKLWFIITFYFVGSHLFKDYSNIKRYMWIYIIPLTGVAIYTIIHHSMYGFEQKPAHWVMNPFFNDHTSYAAILAMFFPILLGFVYNSSYSFYIKFVTSLLIVIHALAIILSYTRAAWLSLVMVLGVYIILELKIKFRTLAIAFITLVLLFFTFQEQFVMKLEKNRQDSSDDISKHVQSISNISSDASNLERVNRWHAAFKMFKERPVFGWGPGTYQFKYAPYQLSYEKTIISTDFGEKGNAHSEYIGPLCESGMLGSLSFILIIGIVIYRTVILYNSMQKSEMKLLLVVMFLGFLTYVIHGSLNNFLDTDKAAVPFWGFVAAIVAIDIYHSKEQDSRIKRQEPGV